MDPVGVPLAVLATAEQCIRLGKLLRDKYRDYNAAEHSLSLLILEIDAHAVKLEWQVEFLQSVWNGLEERLQTLQNTLFHVLSHKLQYAIEVADTAISRTEARKGRALLRDIKSGRGTVRKVKFAFSLKECLEETLIDLEKWHNKFDPTWFSIARVTRPEVDAALKQRKRASRDSDGIIALQGLRTSSKASRETLAKDLNLMGIGAIEPGSSKSIEGSDLLDAWLITGKRVIVNTFVPDERVSLPGVQEGIRRLALTLTSADPNSFGLLQCHGIIERETPQEQIDVQTFFTFQQPEMKARPEFDLVFRVPRDLGMPTSLRASLRSVRPVSLNVRLALAQSLSNATMYVHSSQFVHKNIRPETILMFEKTKSDVPSLFLVGFENFRMAEGETFRTGDSSWERNLYRHQERIGLWPEETYNMWHDIYSLGVVLLEIGLWTSFTSTDPQNGTKPGPKLAIAPYIKMPPRDRAILVHGFLVKLAKRQLPLAMGEKYAEVVLSCLTCLDDVDPGLGDRADLLDKDGVLIGVEFVESVIVKLQEIAL